MSSSDPRTPPVFTVTSRSEHDPGCSPRSASPSIIIEIAIKMGQFPCDQPTSHAGGDASDDEDGGHGTMMRHGCDTVA